MTEGTKDSIFRVPQRLKNAMSILLTASSIAGCLPKPTQPPIGSIDMPGGPTPAHIEIIPPPLPTETPTRITGKTVEDAAGSNFLEILAQIGSSESQAINSLPEKLFSHQNEGSIIFHTSVPRLNVEGGVIRDTKNPMICYFDDNGEYVVIVNSNMYFFKNSVPLEVTAAHLNECILFHDNVEAKHAEFSKSYPGGNFLNAMQNHPEWLEAAASQAWLFTTRDILIPNKEKMPEGDNIYNQLISIFERCGGDTAKWDEELKNYQGPQPSSRSQSPSPPLFSLWST